MRTLIFLMDIRSDIWIKNVFITIKRQLKYSRKSILSATAKKKKNPNYNEFRHKPTQNPQNIGYFNKFLEKNDLEEHTFILLHFGEVRSSKSVSLSVNQGISCSLRRFQWRIHSLSIQLMWLLAFLGL